MRNCYRLLLMLTMLAQTVRGVCDCNSDGNSARTFLADTNVYVMHSIICDEIPIAGLSCEWDIVAVSNSTIIAVEFTTTSLESADPANNRAEFKNDNGVVITSVTSTELEKLAPTSSPGTAVMVTLNVAPGTSTIPILEFGFIAVATDNEDCQGKNEETIELEIGGELTISSGNFPSHYDNDHVCIFIVIPKNGRALSLNVVYMLTESFQCPEADPVTLTFDFEGSHQKCGVGFHQLERNNIQSRVVVNFKADGIGTRPGWLMHFTEKVAVTCEGDPCNGGHCDRSSGSIVCTNCPSGKIGPRCDIYEVIICERETGVIECPAGQVIDIQEAFYGREDQITCFYENELVTETNCSSPSALEGYGNLCNDKTTCMVTASNSVTGDDPCPVVYKYVRIRHTCIDRCDPNPCQGKKWRNRCKICTRDACDNCQTWWHQSRNRYCKPCCNRHTGKCRKIGKRGKRKCRQFFCST